jgi:serine phosphatase RsbU (regulator of sigma subunit)
LGQGGRLVCFLGDVAGHGPSAARLARDLEDRVSRLAATLSCGALLTELNAALAATWEVGLFASAVCFSLDTWSGQGSVAAAGQLPPIVKGGTGARPLPATPGPGLGLVAGHRYLETEFFLAVGDMVVAVTDGITDALASPSDVLGLGAAIRFVETTPAIPNQICVSLLTAAAAVGLRDDATILVAEHQPFDLERPLPIAEDFPWWPREATQIAA